MGQIFNKFSVNGKKRFVRPSVREFHITHDPNFEFKQLNGMDIGNGPNTRGL